MVEARGVEPLFLIAMSSKIQETLYPRRFREGKPSWKSVDVPGCY
jgi:hypothetical protein